MKFKLTLTLLALFAVKAFSQNTFPATGNVGIGTSSPTTNLQITGSNSSSSVAIGVNLTNTAASGKAQYSASNNNGKGIDFGIFGSTAGNGLANSGTLGGNVPLVLITDGNVANGGTNPISFRVGGYSAAQEKVRITANGNVGIGTLTPTEMLTVAGNVSAKEIKVIATAGADFVFEQDYNLPSLKNLETYIITNKHLPDIASANEMVHNGLNLGELNIKLLQKIEELTLHLIRQEKEVGQLRKQIEGIKKKVGNRKY
jgi:hypothetical protein